jgi:hypothetical protein
VHANRTALQAKQCKQRNVNEINLAEGGRKTSESMINIYQIAHITSQTKAACGVTAEKTEISGISLAVSQLCRDR